MGGTGIPFKEINDRGGNPFEKLEKRIGIIKQYIFWFSVEAPRRVPIRSPEAPGAATRLDQIDAETAGATGLVAQAHWAEEGRMAKSIQNFT